MLLCCCVMYTAVATMYGRGWKLNRGAWIRAGVRWLVYGRLGAYPTISL